MRIEAEMGRVFSGGGFGNSFRKSWLTGGHIHDGGAFVTTSKHAFTAENHFLHIIWITHDGKDDIAGLCDFVR